MSRQVPPLVPRMRPFVTSIFGEMSRLAGGVGAINLGQGFPDTDGPDILKAEAQAAIAGGRGNQYPPAHGLPALREAIAEHQERFYGLRLEPATDVVVTTGASEALGASLLALVDDGDEVVTFEPWFDIYDAGIALAGGRRTAVPMRGADLRPDLDALRAAVSPSTRVILLNSPHNPTGVVFTREELQAVADIAIANDVVVIADEAYEHLWYDGSPHLPISTLPGMFERTVTIGSGGKTFSLTGWKVGWASGPADLIAAVRSVRQHLSYVSGGPFQYAMALGLRLPDDYYESFRLDLQDKRDRLADGLSSVGMRVVPTQGTYFTTTDVTPLGFDSGLAFCREVPHRAGVVAIPHSTFCSDPDAPNPYVRWAFCKQPTVLDTAVERLASAFGS